MRARFFGRDADAAIQFVLSNAPVARATRKQEFVKTGWKGQYNVEGRSAVVTPPPSDLGNNHAIGFDPLMNEKKRSKNNGKTFYCIH